VILLEFPRPLDGGTFLCKLTRKREDNLRGFPVLSIFYPLGAHFAKKEEKSSREAGKLGKWSQYQELKGNN